MSRLRIDDREIGFRPGQTVLQAARDAGIYIPHLCWHPDFGSHGSCRICMVRVDGRMQSACTLQARDGLVVESEIEPVRRLRRRLLELLFTEGNHLCPSCEKSGDCLLQAVAEYCGMTAPAFHYRYPHRPLDASHPDMVLDFNRCIHCELCVRASRERDGKSLFRMTGRGIDARIEVNAPGGLLGNSDFSLQDRAANICPVGVFLPRGRAYREPIGQRRFDRQPVEEAAS